MPIRRYSAEKNWHQTCRKISRVQSHQNTTSHALHRAVYLSRAHTTFSDRLTLPNTMPLSSIVYAQLPQEAQSDSSEKLLHASSDAEGMQADQGRCWTSHTRLSALWLLVPLIFSLIANVAFVRMYAVSQSDRPGGDLSWSRLYCTLLAPMLSKNKMHFC